MRNMLLSVLIGSFVVVQGCSLGRDIPYHCDNVPEGIDVQITSRYSSDDLIVEPGTDRTPFVSWQVINCSDSGVRMVPTTVTITGIDASLRRSDGLLVQSVGITSAYSHTPVAILLDTVRIAPDDSSISFLIDSGVVGTQAYGYGAYVLEGGVSTEAGVAEIVVGSPWNFVYEDGSPVPQERISVPAPIVRRVVVMPPSGTF